MASRPFKIGSSNFQIAVYPAGGTVEAKNNVSVYLFNKSNWRVEVEYSALRGPSARTTYPISVVISRRCCLAAAESYHVSTCRQNTAKLTGAKVNRSGNIDEIENVFEKHKV